MTSTAARTKYSSGLPRFTRATFSVILVVQDVTATATRAGIGFDARLKPLPLGSGFRSEWTWASFTRSKTEGFQRSKVMDTVFQLTDVYGPCGRSDLLGAFVAGLEGFANNKVE